MEAEDLLWRPGERRRRRAPDCRYVFVHKFQNVKKKAKPFEL